MAINLQVNFTAKGNFGQLARGLNQLGANITGAQNQIASSGKKVKKELANTEQSLLTASQAAAGFREQQVRLKDPMDQLATSIRKGDLNARGLAQTMKRSVSGDLARRHIALQNAQVQGAFRQADGTVQASMAMQNHNAILETARDRFGVVNQAMRGFSTHMINVGKNTQWTGRQLTVGLTVPIAFMAHAANKAAMEVEGQLVRLEKVYSISGSNITMELNRLQVEMGRTAEASARAFGATRAQTLEVAADFASMGYTVANGLSTMVTEAQRMQQLGEMDLPDAINLVRSVQSAWKLESDELAETMNRLNAIENRTPLLLRDIASAMPEVAAVANQMGISTTYAAAAMASMREGGLDAGEAAMALRQLIIRMVDPTEVARERFIELGINLEELFEGAENGEEMINRLSAAMSGLTGEEQIKGLSKLVDVRQAARIQLLLSSMADAAEGSENAWSRAYEVIGMGAEELADDAAHESQRWRESAVGQAEIAKARINNELAEIGQPLMAVFNAFRNAAARLLEMFNGLSGGAKKFILMGLGITAIIGPVIMLSGVLLNAFFSVMKMATGINNLFLRTKLLTREERVLQDMIQRGIPIQDNYEEVLERVRMQMDETAQSGKRLAQSNKEIEQSALQASDAIRADQVGDEGVVVDRRRQRGPMTKAKMGGIIAGGGAALAGVSSMISMLVGSEGPLANVLNVVTNIGMAAALIGPALLAALPAAISLSTALIAITAAVAVVAAGMALWRNHTQKVAAETETASDAAQKMAESAGIAYSEVGDIISDVAEENIQSFTDANHEAIQQMRNMKTRAQQEAYAFSIAYDMKRHGASDEEIKIQIAKLAKEAGANVRLSVILDYDEDNIRQQVAELATRSQENQDEKWYHVSTQRIKANFHKLLNLNEEGFELLEASTLDSIETIAQMAGESLKAGDWEAYYAAAQQAEKSWAEEVEGGTMSVEEAEQARARLAVRIAQISELQGFDISQIKDLTSLNEALASGHIGVAKAIMEVAAAELRLADARAHAAGEWRGVPYKTPQRDVIDAIKELDRAQNELDSQNEAVASSFADSQAGAEGYAGGLGDVTDAANELQSAVKSEMDALQDMLGGFVLDEIKAGHSAVMDAWDARIDKEKDGHKLIREEQKKTHEQEMDDLEDTYDARIKTLEDTLDTEEELDRLREYAHAREKRRQDWQNRRAQGTLDIAAAMARGEVDEAARISQQMTADTAAYRMEEEAAVRGFEDENRKRAINLQIDELEEAKKIATDHLKVEQKLAADRLKTEQDLQANRLKAQKDAVDRSNKLELERAEWQIKMWKRTTAGNQAEYEAGLAKLGQLAADFGVTTLQPIADRYEYILDESIYAGFGSAYQRAQDALYEKEKWEPAAEAAGETIKEGAAKGILGQQYETDPHKRTQGGVARHSGGIIPAKTKQPGLAQGEVPAVLQSGEYVVQRKAVKSLGVGFLEQLNRYHQGGLIDNVAQYAPLRAMSYTLGQVVAGRELNETGRIGSALYESLTGSGLLYGGGQEGTGAFERGGGRYPARKWGVLSSNTAAAMRFAKGSWDELKAVAPDVGRDDRQSDHSYGKALDLAVTQIGKFPNEMQRALGWQVANWFVKNPSDFGTKYVIWDKKINTGGGWRPYTRYDSQPNNPTLQHYDHVHASFLHGGGLAGKDGRKLTIPSLAKGASVNFDNMLANLHKGETVLTSPLSSKLEAGIDALANGGGTVYDVDIHVNGNVSEQNTQRLARDIRLELQKMENRQGRNRRVG